MMDTPRMHWGSPAAVLEINGRVFQAGEPELAGAVAEAHAARRRPRCLCQPGGVPMYVARLRDGYCVKRMPDTGSQHAVHCPCYALPPDLTGLTGIAGGAIVEDPASGDTTLRLDFPLSTSSGRAAHDPVPAYPGAVSARASRLSMLALLHYLWDESGLTQWQPGFDGRRTWSTVRRLLLHAAERKLAAGCSLTGRLYLPERFRPEALAALQARRQAAWAQVQVRRSGPQPLLLMIAELKGISPGPTGHRLTFKHIPDVKFCIDEALLLGMDRRFGEALDLWGACEDVRLITAATFSVTPAGAPVIARLCLMPVNRQWLPIESRADKELVDNLARQGRSFRKVLRYDRAPGQPLASVALTEPGGPMTLLYVPAPRDDDPTPDAGPAADAGPVSAGTDPAG